MLFNMHKTKKKKYSDRQTMLYNSLCIVEGHVKFHGQNSNKMKECILNTRLGDGHQQNYVTVKYSKNCIQGWML